MSIDYEKAIDTIEWEFLFKTLEYFNFGETLMNCIKISYNGCPSTFFNNGTFAGNMSNYTVG